MTYDVLRVRFVLLLIVLPLLVGACDLLLGLETPRATVDAAIDAASTVDAAGTDAISAAPDAAPDVDAPVSMPDAEPPPPDAAVPDACVFELFCSDGNVHDVCTGEVAICQDGRCCNRGKGIAHCLMPGEVCNN